MSLKKFTFAILLVFLFALCAEAQIIQTGTLSGPTQEKEGESPCPGSPSPSSPRR